MKNVGNTKFCYFDIFASMLCAMKGGYQMKPVYHKAKNFKEAEGWDILQTFFKNKASLERPKDLEYLKYLRKRVEISDNK